MEEIKSIISKQLTNLGYADYEFSEIDKAAVALDANGKPFYEKWRLLTIFKRRLKGSLLHNDGSEMIDFLKGAIAALESISDDSVIYFWKIKTKGKHVSGRSTKEQILHIFPTGDENPD